MVRFIGRILGIANWNLRIPILRILLLGFQFWKHNVFIGLLCGSARVMCAPLDGYVAVVHLLIWNTDVTVQNPQSARRESPSNDWSGASNVLHCQASISLHHPSLNHLSRNFWMYSGGNGHLLCVHLFQKDQGDFPEPSYWVLLWWVFFLLQLEETSFLLSLCDQQTPNIMLTESSNNPGDCLKIISVNMIARARVSWLS